MCEEKTERHSFVIKNRRKGRRIDHYIAGRLQDRSRSYIQKLIRREMVTLNGRYPKPSSTIKYGDVIEVDLPVFRPAARIAEDIPLDVVYEDDDFIALNKPAGMVTHPAKGHYRGTLVNALLHHCDWTPEDPLDVRPGVVHRLDKNTSGVMLFAKHELAQSLIQQQFQRRTVAKTYLAIVHGDPQFDEDIIKLPLNRHPYDRKRQTVDRTEGKECVTHYFTRERFGDYALIEARPKTGRTHQIRVHLAAIHHPVVCDVTYGAHLAEVFRSQLLDRAIAEDEKPLIKRTALHAYTIEINHPTTHKRCRFEVPPPEDFAGLLDELRGRGPVNLQEAR